MNRRMKKRGMVLSIILMVLAIMVVLGTLFASLGTVNLGFAAQDANKERAYQAAEAGLVNATTSMVVNGQLPQGAPLGTTGTYGNSYLSATIGSGGTTFQLPNSPQQDYATVTVQTAVGSKPLPIPDAHLSIPGGTTYVISEGFACANGSPICSAKVGALFSLPGSEASAYAVQAGKIVVNPPTGGTFTLSGWNSSQDPTPQKNTTSPALMATNSTVAGAVNVTGGTLNGQLLVPHSAPSNVIVGSNANPGYLTGPMDFGFNNAAVTLSTGLTGAAGPGLSPNDYDTITVDGVCVLGTGTYRANKLIIHSGGSISTAVGSQPVVLVVEKTLTTPSDNMANFLNPGNPSNVLNVTYLGTDDASITLSSASPVTFAAPNAKLTINAPGSMVSGAWFAQGLTLNVQSGAQIFCDLNYGYVKPPVNPPYDNAGQSQQNASAIPHYVFLSKQRL